MWPIAGASPVLPPRHFLVTTLSQLADAGEHMGAGSNLACLCSLSADILYWEAQIRRRRQYDQNTAAPMQSLQNSRWI